MLKRSLLFFCVTGLAGRVLADTRPITLEAAIERAMHQNASVQSAESEVRASEAQYKRSSSTFLPKIGAESRYEYIDSPFQMQRGATSDLFLEWNLFNGFRDWYDRKAKGWELDRAKAARQQQDALLAADVEAKFYKILAAIESVKAYREALQRNDSQQEAAKRRRGAGLASDADILEFDLYTTELQSGLSHFKSELIAYEAQFRELLGEEDASVDFEPDAKLIHFHLDNNLGELKQRGLTENQSLLAARFEVEQAKANTKVAAGGYLPELGIKATYGSRGIVDTEVTPETTIVGTARWEFFSGFDTTRARAEARAKTDLALAKLKQHELAIMTSVESAFAALKAIQDHVDIEGENKVKAKKFFDVVTGEYKRGVKNSADLKSAAQVFLEVNLRDIQYRADFFEQKAVLEKAIGGPVKISRGSLSGHTD